MSKAIHTFVGTLALLSLASSANAALLITEVMYDPAGGNEHEYVELFNSGNSTIDLTGYTLSDDPGQASPNTFTLPGGSIDPGDTALLVRIDTSARLLVNYQNAWGAGLNFIEVNPWPVFTNSGDTVALFDPSNTQIAAVNYRSSNGFPSSNDSASIAILDPSAPNPYDASNWGLSVDGVDGARFGNAPRAGDLGSPGFVVPEPTTLAILMMGGLALTRRQR